MIHSSSATIGIVMGLGAAGVLEWQTAVAFSLGADLGTTITSWMASWNLSKNAKRAAYAHITFNIIGVAVMFPLFFVSMQLLVWVMGWFGGDPGVAVVVDGKETFPLVPVAVGLYSTFFNIFNTALMFPFIGVFDRVLSRIGHSRRRRCRGLFAASLPGSEPEQRYCNRRPGRAAGDRSLSRGRREVSGVARGTAGCAGRCGGALCCDRRAQPRHSSVHGGDVQARHAAFQADLLASLIEEEDWTASLGETLYQIARRVKRQTFSEPGRALVNETLDMVANAMHAIVPGSGRDTAIRCDLGRPRTPRSWRCATVACGSVRNCRGRSVALS